MSKVVILKKRKYKAIGCCDLCGAAMVIRNGKYGEFAGCLNYPKCRNTWSEREMENQRWRDFD